MPKPKTIQPESQMKMSMFIVELGTKKSKFQFAVMLLLGKLFSKICTFSHLVCLRPTNLMLKKTSYESLKKTKEKPKKTPNKQKTKTKTKQNKPKIPITPTRKYQSQKLLGRNDCQHSRLKYILYIAFRCMPSSIPGTLISLP